MKDIIKSVIIHSCDFSLKKSSLFIVGINPAFIMLLFATSGFHS